MILSAKDFKTHSLKNGEMGQIVRLHTPTGTCFAEVLMDEGMDKKFSHFIVFQLSEDGEMMNDERFDTASEKSEEEFFKAVDYFEQLINERQPQKKNPPPSFGRFVFEKGANGLIVIPEMDVVTVDWEDMDKVFTPPMNKPYGRLDMTAVDKERYNVVKSKFALNYNEEATKEYEKLNSFPEGRISIYDMTPYSNGTPEEDGESDPSQVNDQEMTLDQIEGENTENMKGSDTNEDKETDMDGSGEGEDSDKAGDDGDTKGGEGKSGDESGKDSKGNEPKKDDQERKDREMKGAAALKDYDPDSGNEDLDQLLKQTKPESVVKSLNNVFGRDIKEMFRKQERLMKAIEGITPDQLAEFEEALGFETSGMPMSEFEKFIKTKTKDYFDK